MGSSINREKAKAAISETSLDDPEFDTAISGAHKFELIKRKDDQTHKENLAKAERGSLGALFGNSTNAASNAAVLVIICSVLLTAFCMYNAAQESASDDWGIWGERALAMVATALAYLFGKSSSN